MITRKIKNLKDIIVCERKYLAASRQYRQFRKSSMVKCAVVVHLYYPEMWPVFKQRLIGMSQIPFDLFISLPEHEARFKDELKKDYPSCIVVVARNRGRDVLPFLFMLQIIQREGYEYLLKVHSKKSPQRKDGNQWSSELLDNLIVADAGMQNKLVNILERPATGIVGPAGNYVPLPTYYNDNRALILTGISELYGDDVAKNVEQDAWKYGFFAGTMFWARVDAFDMIIKRRFPVRYFAKESGQLDGTFAHALERIFSLGCEVSDKKMYEMSKSTTKETPYASELVPEWSDLHQDH